MEVQISRQLLVFGQAIVLGLSVGIVYDLLRPFRLRLSRLCGLLDFLYCLGVGAAVFLFTLQRVEGQLRGFVLLGILGGAVLFFCAFSAALRPLWAFWTDTLEALARIAAFPLRLLFQFCEKTYLSGKNLFCCRKTGRNNPSKHYENKKHIDRKDHISGN